MGDGDALMAELLHANDGPVTPFVAIYRAMKAVESGANPEAVTNALHSALESLEISGTIDSNERPHGY